MDFNLTNALLLIIIAAVFGYISRPRNSLLRSKGGRRLGPLRVKSGRDVSPGQFVYVVRIELHETKQRNNQQDKIQHAYYTLCSGSVLTPTATLTAFHCLNSELPTEEKQATYEININYVIRYGSAPGKPADNQLDKFSNILDSTGVPSGRDQVHPLLINDVVIARTEPIYLTSFGKISSLDYRSLFGLQVTLMGYGATNQSSNVASDTLRLKLPLQVLDGMLIACDADSRAPFPLLCANSGCGNPGGLVGPGDSGGPVVHSSGIVGVMSMSVFEFFKIDPDYTPIPSQGYITPLSPYIDWLTRATKEKKEMDNS